MSQRYLFGPVTAAFAEQKLHDQRHAGTCLTFNASGDADVQIAAGDDWETVVCRFPAGWQADFLVLNLGYTCVPECLWSVPVPLVGLAQDWPLLWHYYRRRLRQCELVLTDTLGVETLQREGMAHARVANLFGCDRSYVEEPWPQTARDIDVLFVGNFNPAVQRQRLPWLARLARLTDHRRVLLTTGVFGADYRRLLGRARIVFNYAMRGECNLRVFEAAAAGALLFQEEGNREVPTYFRDRRECVFYNAENLETLLEYYLDHEDQRRAIAEAARVRVEQYTFAKLWEKNLEWIEAEWPALQERVEGRFSPTVAESLRTRTWQLLGSSLGDDPTLAGDLSLALEREPHAALQSSLGLVAGLGLEDRDARSPVNPVVSALEHFRAALTLAPTDALTGLNAAEALASLGQREEAVAQARRTLQTLDQSDNLTLSCLDGAHAPPAFDLFRVEWERAAWDNAGRPEREIAAKRDLLRWSLHGILAECTGAREHYLQAQQARPDLWTSRAALGCALGRAGLPAEAVEHLRVAVAANPFDTAAARALYQALAETGDSEAQRELARQCRALAAAVAFLAPEPWFAAQGDHSVASSTGEDSGWLQALSLAEFHARFGALDTAAALCGFTNPPDTHVILTLLAHARPRRILEIGTALGHMTANFTQWSEDDAVIFTLGTTAELAAPTVAPQRSETPDRQHLGCLANAFGKVSKALFITADSFGYDFSRLGPLDFAFIDGAHDFPHVLADTLKVYEVLRPGGYLVWHDFTSPAPWVEVRQVLEHIRFAEGVVHVAGTAVAFLCKGAAPAKPALLPPAAAAAQAAPAPVAAEQEDGGLCIVWEGAQQAVHSFAAVNRALCTHLLARGHAISVLASAHPGLAERALDGTMPPPEYQMLAGDDVPLPPRLAQSFYRVLPRPADVHVRHLSYFP